MIGTWTQGNFTAELWRWSDRFGIFLFPTKDREDLYEDIIFSPERSFEYVEDCVQELFISHAGFGYPEWNLAPRFTPTTEKNRW